MLMLSGVQLYFPVFFRVLVKEPFKMFICLGFVFIISMSCICAFNFCIHCMGEIYVLYFILLGLLSLMPPLLNSVLYVLMHTVFL